MLSESFALFQQEGILARSSLLAGFNALRKANVDDVNKGLFYSAFFELSIGFERLMKLVLVIDHMAKHELVPMTDKELKANYGHKIESLYNSCAKLGEGQDGLNGRFYGNGDFEWKIVHFLHDFAISSRYYNLSKITKEQKTEDPLCEWWCILRDVIRSDVSVKRKKKIESESLAICDSCSRYTFVLMHGLDGRQMTMLDFLKDQQLIEAAAPYMVWHVFKILIPFYNLISDVVGAVHAIEKHRGIDATQVPYMGEFFSFLVLGKSVVVKRKKWS